MEWGVFEIKDSHGVLLCLHIAPITKEGYQHPAYTLEADSPTVERIEYEDGCVPLVIHHHFN